MSQFTNSTFILTEPLLCFSFKLTNGTPPLRLSMPMGGFSFVLWNVDPLRQPTLVPPSVSFFSFQNLAILSLTISPSPPRKRKKWTENRKTQSKSSNSVWNWCRIERIGWFNPVWPRFSPKSRSPCKSVQNQIGLLRFWFESADFDLNRPIFPTMEYIVQK